LNEELDPLVANMAKPHNAWLKKRLEQQMVIKLCAKILRIENEVAELTRK
jgi:hypothetical protein